ncbi:uncharacterized protein LOC108873276 isoform X1 [Lates calcarifer]|uniref:Uncharacterized protein LOC108873276 isoform X1 n=1 Tax=Lates calcarifer TaxID=8187 RepID=A0AAJ7L8W2_LATCA|nr:uncharacterized protein LOC108873276 isoform X1 [Lates calcarifer]
METLFSSMHRTSFQELKEKMPQFSVPLLFPGTTKIFCKNKCEPGNILIETTEDTAQRGRYSIRYKETNVALLSVTFTNLTKSDSGLYSCGLIRTQLVQFEIIVRDALLTGNHEDKLLKMRTGEDVTVQCFFTSFGISKFFCKDSCQEKVLVGTAGDRAQIDRYSIRYLTGTRGGSFLFVTITNLTKSDSGQYWCGLDSSSLRDFELIVTDASVASTPPTTDQSDTTPEDVMLYVGVTLGLLVILLAVAALVFYRKRTLKSKEPPVEAEYASVTEVNRVYEGIREGDRQSRPPVEISSVHTGATYTKSDGAKTSDDSFDAGATSQHQAEDDSGALTYAQVNFSAAGSSTREPRGNDTDVVYSALKVDEGSDDNPLYSAVS